MFARAGWAAAAASLAVALAPGAASAHGRFPEIGQIAFHPTDPDVIVARGTFGLVVSKDGGDSWRWICLDAVGARLTEDPDLVVMEDGSIVATLFDGLVRGTDGGCDWGFPDPDLEGTVVISQAQDPTDPAAGLVVTSNGGSDNLVYRTEDDGASWAPTGDPIDPILFETIEIAPSDPDVVYLTGAYPPSMTSPRMPYVYRSGDGGGSWESFAWSGPFEEGDRNIFLEGVDPTDPMHLFIHLLSDNDDQLLESMDGGESWTQAVAMPDIGGFAWSEDGSTIWVGGDESGLWRSVDGGAFEQVRDDVEISCLAVRGDELWACANDFSDGFAIGVSADGGGSFEPVLVFGDIAGVVECPDGSEVPTTCEPELADLRTDLGIATDGGVGADGGTGGGGDDGGCSCRAAGGGSGPSSPVWLGLLVGSIALWRRRRGLG